MRNTEEASTSQRQAVTEAFDLIATLYDRWFESPLGAYVWTVEMAAIMTMLPSRITGVVLDVGVGTGMSLDPLLPLNAQTIGIDLSWQMLRIAREKTQGHSHINLVLADAEQLPFRQSSLELVMGITIIEFVPDQRQMLQDIYRVMTSGGYFVLGVLSSTSLWGIERRLRNIAKKDVFAYAKFMSPWHLAKRLLQTGFAVIEYRGSVYAPTMTPSTLLPSFAQLDSELGTRWLSRSFGAFLVFRARKPAVNSEAL